MVVISILVFFVTILGLGFTITRFVNESDNFLERNLMRIGFGLGFFIVLGLFFNVVRVPLDWRIFLIASLIIPVFYFLKNIKNIKFNLKPSITKYDLSILIMLLIFFAAFYMYSKGAFSYPWLEDDDSWGHAIGVKYVAVEKTVFSKQPLRYIDPYPPSYDMLLGILHQTNNSIYWTLKFFNALIISLGIIFFFFFVKELTDKNKALLSTFFIASIPAFSSHFIWAIALSVPLYFVSFYATEKIKHDKKWFIVAAIIIGASLTISPTHSTYFGLLFAIYYGTKAIIEKNILIYHAAAGFFGLIVSFLWWVPSIIKHRLNGMLNGIGLREVSEIVSVHGTADRLYTVKDFFIAQKVNMINNPIGIGLVVSLLVAFAVVSLIYKNYNEINKNRLKIFIISVLITGALLFFLSNTYTKNVLKKGVSIAEKGTVPFSEFLFDQRFLVLTLALMIFVFVSLLIASYTNNDFKDKWCTIVIAWFIFAFYAVNAAPFYYKISPFRVWSIFAIPVAILAAEGAWFLASLLKNFRIPKFILIAVIVVGVIFTSGYQKYTVNTAQWPPGGFWTSSEELQGYMWFKDNIPTETKVFTFSNNGIIIGLDKFICHWCNDVKDYQRTGFNQSVEQNYNWLKKEKYTYIIIDGQAVRKFGVNETNKKIQEFLNSSKFFKPVFSNNGVIIFGVI